MPTSELRERLPRLRIPLYASVVWSLQGGFWLTHDSFDLSPRLPIVFSAIACLLMLHHGFTAETWVLAPRARASRRVGVISALLVVAAGINLRGARVDSAGKVASCVGFGVSILYLWLFTGTVFRIGERSR
jgi:hypothetical protein